MRALITGISGFVGRHLARELADHGAAVFGFDLAVPSSPIPGVDRVIPGDVTRATSVSAAVEETRPDAIIHLAGAAAVGPSFADPVGTWRINLDGTLAVLEAVRTVRPTARCLVVTTSEIYGLVPIDQLPVTEHTPIRPHSPYAASKAAADIAARQYRDGFGLDILRVRPFNHIGPGQDTRFVVPTVARQIAEGEREGAHTISISVGNTATRRDFSDVRDIVRAYRLILEKGDPDVAYLPCSGRSRAVSELLDGLAGLAGRPVTITSDESRVRHGEQPDLYGSADRLAADTGWRPEIPFETTLRDTLDDWRERVSKETPD